MCPSARRAGDRASAGPGPGGVDTTAGSDWAHVGRKAGAGRNSLHTGEMEECLHSSTSGGAREGPALSLDPPVASRRR